MQAKPQIIRSPVYRYNAQSYILVSLISFAGTVVLTRLFLEITGYPQLGKGELHIAHVLWGGLLLFIATLFPLLLANRWALDTSAVLSGVGIGLFIDEVGKFITRDNNYFYPAAAPIIYAFFLLTVVLYMRIRRSEPHDSRQQLYQALETMTEILDHDLEFDERDDLVRRLEVVKSDVDNPNLSILAQTLLDYIQSEKITVHDARLTVIERLHRRYTRWESTVFTRLRMRVGLIIAMLLVGVFAWYELAVIVPSLASHGKFVETVILTGMQRGEVRSAIGAIWFFIHLGMQGVVGLLALTSSTLMVLRKDNLATQIASACMVLSLTAVNLLAFFVDQFSTAAIAIFQLLVLIGLAAYRRRFLPKEKVA
ncbi:MAG TPA: hypothetical protein PJ988_00675 [Anaerolinea sp.]|nr:hypothetical protein [Anaerolinea sp.]